MGGQKPTLRSSRRCTTIPIPPRFCGSSRRVKATITPHASGRKCFLSLFQKLQEPSSWSLQGSGTGRKDVLWVGDGGGVSASRGGSEVSEPKWEGAGGARGTAPIHHLCVAAPPHLPRQNSHPLESRLRESLRTPPSPTHHTSPHISLPESVFSDSSITEAAASCRGLGSLFCQLSQQFLWASSLSIPALPYPGLRGIVLISK